MDPLELVSLEPVYEDERGEIFDLLDGELIRHVGLITCTDGAVRGNHYHEEQSQWTYVTEGTLQCYAEDRRDGADIETRHLEMHEGDMVYIPPNVVHAFVATGEATFLDFNDRPRGNEGELYEEDTVRVDEITT